MARESGRGASHSAVEKAKAPAPAMRRWGTTVLLCGVMLTQAGTARAETAGPVRLPTCEPFLLPVARVVPAPAQYRDFCERHPGECDMSGASVMQLSIGAWRTLNEINRAVNAEISFVPDPEEYGFEDYWTLPSGGYGDCEDFALEKRRRLVEAGLPRAAMRMAIVQHQLRLFSHAVLTVNTTRGGIVLDDLGEGLICWNDAPFNYEMRENLDGSWSRFDQTEWPLFPLPQLHLDDQTATPP
jgi:predicted transglutaminase-like cysteine proteinase